MNKAPEKLQLTWSKSELGWTVRVLHKAVLSVWKGLGGWFWTRIHDDGQLDEHHGPFPDGHAACTDAGRKTFPEAA